MMHRRRFIQASLLLAGPARWLSSCKGKKPIGGKIVGASAGIGHLVRDRRFGAPSEVIKKQTMIVGGGVSGLSAARQLHSSGRDFLLLDLEKNMGGNAAYGSNSISPFPWGAHYVPLPNNTLTEYLDFLRSCGVIVGEDEKGEPIYREEYLCFTPEDRLYINGRWQEGLIPHFGVPQEEQRQIQNFLSLMEGFRHAKGSDDRDAFALPVDASSKDEEFTKLDRITMKEWLASKGLTSPSLHWYVNYCTRDDFGTPLDKVSAWAGIHYFASRKGRAANAERHDLLTWPQGNGWLTEQLQEGWKEKMQNDCLAVSVRYVDDKVLVDYLDIKKDKLVRVEADHCILAIPQFVAARLLGDAERIERAKSLHYVPWMVANLSVDKLQERSGAPPSWDNVLYKGKGLGYVDATHQLLQQHTGARNLTYYLPLTEGSIAEERKAAQQRTHEEWVQMILDDLLPVHPNLSSSLREVNVMIWGHSMPQPLPGMIHGGLRPQLSASINNHIHFAHTDLAGVSIFEEGFYQGLNAAKKILSA